MPRPNKRTLASRKSCQQAAIAKRRRTVAASENWEIPAGAPSEGHQEKKSASRRTGSVRTHQALGTLWTHPVSAHTAPNAKRTGNVNSDADRHGICLPDRAWQGIFLLDAPCQGIFLLDTAVSGHFPTGHVRMTHVMAPRSRWLSRCRTSQQILLVSHSQTRSGFQAL